MASPFSLTARQKYWVGLIGSLTVGLVLKLLPHWSLYESWSSEWKDLASEAGGALIIAFLLAVLVDAALKEELLTEFARDVSGHIIGNLLPVKLRKHLVDYLEMTLVRDNWRITYTLMPCDTEHYVQVTVSSDYEMENRSSDEQPFEFVIKVEKSWFSVGQNLITMVRVNDEPPVENPNCVEKDGNWVHQMSVRLPAFDKDNPHRFRFRTESVQYFFEQAFSPFISMWPVPGVTVTVNDPMKLYEVAFDPTFKTKNEPKSMRLQSGMQTQWEIKEPILPGQGFFVRWSRKAVPVTAPISVRVRGTAA